MIQRLSPAISSAAMSAGWATLAVAINAGIGIYALRTLWKAQHQLDIRGHLIRWSLILFGGVAFPLLYGPFFSGSIAKVVLFGAGMLAILMFLFPDIVYFYLRWYDSRRGEKASSRTWQA